MWPSTSERFEISESCLVFYSIMSLWACRPAPRGKACTDYSPCVSWNTLQDFWYYCLNPIKFPLERRFFQCVSPYLQENLGLTLVIHIYRTYGNVCLFNPLTSNARCNECHAKDRFVYIETWNWPWRADFTWAKPHELPFSVPILSRKQSRLLVWALILMENRNRSGCMGRREGSEEVWEREW